MTVNKNIYKYRVIIPKMKDPLKPEEKRCAVRLAKYFESDVKVIPASQIGSSPDVLALKSSQRWEIKSIYKNGANTIKNAMSRAKSQSENLVINLYRTKMRYQNAAGKIREQLKKPNRFKRVLLITRDEKVLVIKWKK